MKSRLLLAWLAAVVAVSATGCSDRAPPPHEKRKAKPGTASLPPTPDLNPPQVPDKHPDGAFSVRGLLAADRKTLPESLQVKGYVAAQTLCPPTEASCKPAPHLYLSDQADGLGRRMLVGGERNLEARALRVGDLVTLTGRFATSSPDGIYFAPAGLLLLAPMAPPAGADAAP